MRPGRAGASLFLVRGRVRQPVRSRRTLFEGIVSALARTDATSRHALLSVRGHSVAWLVPLLLLAAIVVADVTTNLFQIIAWTVLVPGVAAAICGVRSTAVFAVLALVVYVLADTVWKHRAETGLPGLVLVLVGGFVAVVAAAFRVAGERRMLHMRDVAETTRRTVLRALPDGFGGLEHAAVYLSADSDARVGGDFFDIQPGPYGTRVLVGDVQGKGLGAVDAAAALLGTFREAAYHVPDLAVVAEHLDLRMLRHRAHTAALGEANGDRFATGVLVGFRSDMPAAVELVNFGHEPPLAVGPGGVRRLPVAGGLPLGMRELLPGDFLTTVRAGLAEDETLLLVTDGVVEARDPDGAFYDHEATVALAVEADPSDTSPRRLVAVVRDGTLRHCRGRLTDDTTVFAVRRSGRPPVWP
ncbi:PP2C family protein-serine/threonine phosphatase [Streptomyces sp. NPDC058762]|uniref:PP2C family protein-serine/threonine phosphatase n=1 Tax=Streptomyces sp. NPDC058762 TaxID=3346629 RepID=UPI0036B93587